MIPPLPLQLCAIVPQLNFDNAFGMDPTSDEFQAVKREMQQLQLLSTTHASEVLSVLPSMRSIAAILCKLSAEITQHFRLMVVSAGSRKGCPIVSCMK